MAKSTTVAPGVGRERPSHTNRTIGGKPFKALLPFNHTQVLSFSLDYFAYFTSPHDVYVGCPVRSGDRLN
jgi:hypothetical protein